MNKYVSPLSNRYGSEEMRTLWSDQVKYTMWRKLWYILAETQKELGLDITDEQLTDLRQNINTVNIESVKALEKETQHDVVAHLKAYCLDAPLAAPILHIGATSQYLVDNTDTLLIRDSLMRLVMLTAKVIDKLGEFTEKYADMPTVGLTHFQPAQPTTVGKRSAIWTQNFVTVIEELGFRLDKLKFRGLKGTTGTQASFMNLFDGDFAKVIAMDVMVAQKMGADGSLLKVTGQTYPRILDASLVSTVCLIASAAAKFATDIRLLTSKREIAEVFNKDKQVGSSAMVYKKNPIVCEKICSLSRYLISLVENPYHTAANQWIERTLDDSAGKRILLPEVFILADEILTSTYDVICNIEINEDIIEKNYKENLPFFITENVIIEAVKQGVDRQEAHEELRKLSMSVQDRVNKGLKNNLLTKISRKKLFKGINVKELMNKDYTGLAKKQALEFVSDAVKVVRKAYLDRNKPS
jgi:adenylosuccinate lyase